MLPSAGTEITRSPKDCPTATSSTTIRAGSADPNSPTAHAPPPHRFLEVHRPAERHGKPIRRLPPPYAQEDMEVVPFLQYWHDCEKFSLPNR